MESARAAITERELELQVEAEAANSREAGMRRLRDADIFVVAVTMIGLVAMVAMVVMMTVK